MTHSPPSDETHDSENEGESTEEYHSLDSESESELDNTPEGSPDSETQPEEQQAREREKQRVLEAAGLIIKPSNDAPPVRRRSIKKRRPPPPAPLRARTSAHNGTDTDRDLPPVPCQEEELETENEAPQPSASPLDDAFERYESFKQKDLRRLSTISISTVDSTAPSLVNNTIPSYISSPRHTHSRLHDLLTRKTTPIQEEKVGSRLSTSSISAPILGTPPLSRDRSPAFGSSWCSLVDKSALEGIAPEERKRQEAIFELIYTESAYVRDLQLIVEIFYSKMMHLLDRKAITVIFANIEDILLTNTTFLSSLEDRQRECRLYVDTIGDILEQHMTQMGVYMQYCVNHATAIQVLQNLREKQSELARFLQTTREDPVVRNLDLSSYLLVPMQRITRYPLLIRKISNYTRPDQDRSQIEISLRNAESLLETINESIREQEGRARLQAISKDLWIGKGRLDLMAPTRSMGQRILLREGDLTKAKSGRKLKAFLCNDILILTDASARSLYRMPIPLPEMTVSELEGKRDDLTFQVILAYPRGGDTIKLRALTARDCQMWMKFIGEAKEKCIDADQKAIRREQRRTRQNYS